VSRLVVSGPATLWSWPVIAAVVIVVGLQLLPVRWVENWQLRIEQANPLVLASALAMTVLLVGATVPSQGVPPFIYFRF
jgi:hypothetical protein